MYGKTKPNSKNKVSNSNKNKNKTMFHGMPRFRFYIVFDFKYVFNSSFVCVCITYTNWSKQSLACSFRFGRNFKDGCEFLSHSIVFSFGFCCCCSLILYTEPATKTYSYYICWCNFSTFRIKFYQNQ